MATFPAIGRQPRGRPSPSLPHTAGPPDDTAAPTPRNRHGFRLLDTVRRVVLVARHRRSRRSCPTAARPGTPFTTITDTHDDSGVDHLITLDQAGELPAGGRARALCGHLVMPAPLTAPPGRRCPRCHQRATAGTATQLE